MVELCSIETEHDEAQSELSESGWVKYVVLTFLLGDSLSDSSSPAEERSTNDMIDEVEELLQDSVETTFLFFVRWSLSKPKWALSP